MSSISGGRRSGRQRPAAGPLRLRLRRLLYRASQPLLRMVKALRNRQNSRYVHTARPWRSSRRSIRAVRIISYGGAVLLLIWLTWALYELIRRESNGLPFDLEERCEGASFSCDTVAGTLLPVLSLAVASAVFLLFRLRRLRRPYVLRAQRSPRDVVPTAGTIIGEVVGRDELCNVIIDDVRDGRTRRPHIVVAAVGAGKTALLVQLTKLLAERGAVPVAVRLRDAQDQLDFRDLARRRFLGELGDRQLSGTDGEKAWRHLRNNQEVVVLADGLEEALIEGEPGKDRDNLIRLAIRQANADRLPLIITSRPHNLLRETEATIVELEPLSEEAALEYVRPTTSTQDERRLDWIIETADVTEAPLYLQITRQLHRAGLMEDLSSRDGGRLDTRSVDRAELRLRLLRSWTDALLDGYLHRSLRLPFKDRKASLEQLSALACIGLKQDQLHVRYEEFDALANTSPPSHLIEAVKSELGHPLNIRLAATWGMQLDLVEARGDGVRFPHSVVQAYLGSRLIEHAMADTAYLEEALAKPGREFLIALVMHSRWKVAEARRRGASEASVAVQRADTEDQRLQAALCRVASKRSDEKALDLYAAALEIDCVDPSPLHEGIATELSDRWPHISAPDHRTLEEAKLNVVRRLGEAARTVAEQGEKRGIGPVTPAYSQLYRIIRIERSYPVRLAAAQEIGAGGDEALAALADALGPPDDTAGAPPPTTPSVRGGPGSDLAPSPAPPGEPRSGDGAGRGPAAGVGGAHDESEEAEEYSWRELTAQAWLAPLLVGSVSQERRDARNNLRLWLRFVQTQSPRHRELGLSLEVALAQGFKNAANRRPPRSQVRLEARDYLIAQVREMLRHSRFWFTRLTLLHALCLTSLPDDTGTRRPGRSGVADPTALVDHWMSVPITQEHPFVAEARRLAALALETGQPERFIWIDESGVVSKVGSRPASPTSPRKHNLWIPPSTGWTALHPRAQQLVADVLLLLNLAERGDPSDRNRRLQYTDLPQLPPCLTGDRSPLNPRRGVGMTASSTPGSNCKHGCRFELCPYPDRGERSQRIELTEAFCRRQEALLHRGAVRRKSAPWQGALPGELQQFWRQMGQQAQPSELEPGEARERSRSRRRPTRP
jgi:hypothetical protein